MGECTSGEPVACSTRIMVEPSRRGWRLIALSGAVMSVVGLLISSDYLVDVDVPLLASALCSTGGVICGTALVRSGKAGNNPDHKRGPGPAN